VTPDERKPEAVVDLLSGTGTGPLWGMASRDLNATLLAWPPGHEVAEHANTEVDVLLVVLGGGGVVVIDQRKHALAPGHVLLVEKGSSRTIRAGADGLRYLSVHKRRGPLTVAPTPKER
jgi:quercetin dioxygenase-like cupin family protein